MTPADLAEVVRERFIEAADSAFAAGQRRFFQHEVDTYGVRTSALHAIARDTYRAIKDWPLARRNAFMKCLWEDGKIESGALACCVYRRFAKQCAECEFHLFERWLDRYANNWAHTDGIASWLLAASIANQPELRFQLTSWTDSPNRWKRRAAAVALLQEAKQGRHTDFIFGIAARLLPQRDDMVEKGVGWLLKETYPRKPKETVAFLMAHRAVASRLTLRYAAGKMTPSHRVRVLARG